MQQLEKQCPICYARFMPKYRSDQIYCSLKCKSLATYKKNYEYYQNYWLTRPNLFKWKKERKCKLCGKLFMLNTCHQLYCKNPCNPKSAWKKRNWKRVLEKQREWFKKARKKDPERYRFYNKNRKHLIRASSGSTKKFSKAFTLEEWKEIKKNHNYRCAICKKRKKLTIDHKIPLSKGGEHNKNNIQPLCFSCNSKKKDSVVNRPYKISSD